MGPIWDGVWGLKGGDGCGDVVAVLVAAVGEGPVAEFGLVRGGVDLKIGQYWICSGDVSSFDRTKELGSCEPQRGRMAIESRQKSTNRKKSTEENNSYLPSPRRTPPFQDNANPSDTASFPPR